MRILFHEVQMQMPLAIEINESELWVMIKNLWMEQLMRGSKEEKVIDKKVQFPSEIKVNIQ
jgi:hypothetical protein